MKLEKIDPGLVEKSYKMDTLIGVEFICLFLRKFRTDMTGYFSKDNTVLSKTFSGIVNVFLKPSLLATLICNIDHGEW